MSNSVGLRERHKAGRRTRILEAARDLLREDPGANPTTEEIARRAEVAPATVYNLIGPREKLWEALADGFMTELEGRIAATRAGDPLMRARRIVELTVDLFIEDPVVARQMLRGWEDSGHVMRSSPLMHLRAALEEAQAQGTLDARFDLPALVAVVGTSCLGSMHEWAVGLIDDRAFRAGAARALDVVLAAAATDAHRERLARRLPRRRTRRGHAA